MNEKKIPIKGRQNLKQDLEFAKVNCRHHDLADDIGLHPKWMRGV